MKFDEALASVEGEWKGSLTYRDYGDPDRMVTLPTELFVTFGSPQELVMHCIYDDGPGKIVHSYETMSVDLAGGRAVWTSGTKERTETTGRVASDSREGASRRLVIESNDDGKVTRQTLELDADRFGM